MKVISTLTNEQEEQLNMSIQTAQEYVNAFKQQPDTAKLKKCLCKVIDEMPNISYLDPDVLSCYDIDSEDSQWVVANEEEDQYNRTQLKRIVNEIEEFKPCQLSLGGSGSILRTIFGDAYDEVGR